MSDYTKGIISACIASIFAMMLTVLGTYLSDVNANTNFRENNEQAVKTIPQDLATIKTDLEWIKEKLKEK